MATRSKTRQAATTELPVSTLAAWQSALDDTCPGPRWQLDHADVRRGASAWVLRARLRSSAPPSPAAVPADVPADLQSVALKVARPGFAEVLRREAVLLARLDRQWGPGLLSAGCVPATTTDDAAPFLIMPWVDGTSLAEWRWRGPPTAGSERASEARPLMEVTLGLARALRELHESAVVHGDIKPDNILVSSHAQVTATLLDLGLSVSEGHASTGATPRYAAPEVLRAEPAQRGSDLYSLGLVLAEQLVPQLNDSTLPHPDEVLRAVERATGRGDAMLRALGTWVIAMLAPSPSSRPSARTLAEVAARALEEPGQVAARTSYAHWPRRAYLARVTTVDAGAEVTFDAGSSQGAACTGLAQAWRQQLFDVWASTFPAAERPAAPPQWHALSTRALRLWLASMGAESAGLELDEATLVPRVQALAERLPPDQWPRDALDDGLANAIDAAPAAGNMHERELAQMWSLARGSIDATTMTLLEPQLRDAHGVPEPLRLAWVEHLMRRGEIGRAYVSLASHGVDGFAGTEAEPQAARAPSSPSAGARLLLAELERRRGQFERALHWLEPVLVDPSSTAHVAARAIAGRTEWDRGDMNAARQHLMQPAPTARHAELAALLAYASRDFASGLHVLTQALEGRQSPEDRCRLHGLRGMLLHAMGQSAESQDAFQYASQLAGDLGARLEEATYLTGLSAAAADAGALAVARHAAESAARVWSQLGEPEKAARALLSLASAELTLGNRLDADEAARLAHDAAKIGGDRRAAFYAAIARLEAQETQDTALWSAARDALRALGTMSSDEDALRLATLELRLGRTPSLAVEHGDTVARTAPGELAFAWLEARLLVGTRATLPTLVGTLRSRLRDAAPTCVKGRALAVAAERAKELGDRESSAAFLGASAALAEHLRRAWPAGVPLPAWAREVNVAAEGFAPQQLRDLAQLVRAMGTRDSLASLFHQTLDSMLLWTGAERGVLMTTWQDRLVIRCARNIERDNLVGEQLRLSQSLAARALRTREPVIATDAASQTEDERASVHALALRSVLAVPLIARGEPCGVVYLDDKTRIGAFGERELAWVRLLAAHAASAIVDARDQVMLRRALRTARRAEAHLQRVLAEREAELVATKAALSTETRYAYRDLIGRGQAMTRLLKLLDRLTDSAIPVLLVGESGTGKELVARALHDNGPRSKAAFVAQNCAAIPEGLLESALFGHVRGAFTGATQSQLGLFEVAHGGTLFLDEIGEMPLSTQVRLLRVLQEGEVRPVGANHMRKVDVRIIGATHRDLEALVKSGQFREDLYYRLHVVTARVPALRERREDMPDLVAHFLTKYAPSGASPPRLDPRAMQCLLQYGWPGNVRQLENELRRALVLSEGVLEVEHFSDAVRSALPAETPTAATQDVARVAGTPRDTEDLRPLRDQIDDLERHAVRLALQACQGNQTRMAERLGISRFGLNKMMKRLGLR